LEKKRPIRKNRFKKNPRQTRQRIARRLMAGLKLMALIAGLVGFSALFMAGYAAVTHNDYFRTAVIKVSGETRLTQAEIVRQAGVRVGDNLLAVNLGLVRKRLLAHPWIAAARVAREIPGTLRIEVTEHQALAVLDLGRKFLIDTSGRIFKECGPDDAQDLPLVTGVVYAEISLGDDALSVPMAAVVDVLQTSQAAGSAIAYDQIREVHLDQKMGISLIAWADRRSIKLGFAQFEAKFGRIGQLLPYLRASRQWQGFHMIDADNPDRIVVRL
jgi:cell division protein FtsQ